MSYRCGIDTIHLRPTERLGHTEYCAHNAPLRRAVEAGTRQRLEDAWKFDLLWLTNDGPVPWGKRGRVTDMGHGEFQEGGVDRRPPQKCPFEDAQQALAFDAVEEYGLPDMEELTAYYSDLHKRRRREYSNAVVPGGYYKTMVSGAIAAFGWDMLLQAAADQQRFERVLDSIFRLSLHHFKAWAKTPIEVFICHDDMVWSQGPFLHPDFYRRAIFPRYAELWAVLKKAGKKVLFCSDGQWTAFLDDIAKAGADGFIFEPMVSLDTVVEKFGATHVIVGSKVDCRTLTFGTQEQIQAQMEATLPLALRCPGFIFAVGNHIPSNVPVENALFYFEYLKAHWAR